MDGFPTLDIQKKSVDVLKRREKEKMKIRNVKVRCYLKASVIKVVISKWEEI